MRLGLRIRARWFRLNMDSERANASGNGNGNGAINKPLVREKQKRNSDHSSDLLKELCTLVSSTAAKANAVPSAASRTKNRFNRFEIDKEICCCSSRGLFSPEEMILDALNSIKPAQTQSISEALGGHFQSVLTDQVVAKVVSGIQDIRIATLFFEWACSHYRPGVLAYDCFLQALIKANKVDEAYHKFRESCTTPSSFAYCVLIEALSSKGYTEESIALFDEVRREHSNGDLVKCLSFLVTGLCKCGRVNEAMLQYKKVKEGLHLNVVAYNALIDGLMRSKLVDKAVEVFKEMYQAFVQPNNHTYAALVSGLCRAGRIDQACEFFNRMLDSGYTPHIVLHTTLIDALCKSKRFDEACEYLERVEEPDIVTYSTLLDGLCSIGRVDYAYELLEQITERVNSQLDVVLYTIFIKGLCKADQLDNAVNLFRKMAKNGVSPNTVTYNSLMRGLSWKGRIEEARKLFKEMITNGCKPDGATYSIISEFFLKSPGLEGARKMVEEFKDDSGEVSSEQVQRLCQEGRVEEAYQVFQAMDRATSGDHSSLVRGFLREGKFLEADKVIRDIWRTGCAPTYELQAAIISGLRQLVRKKNLQNFVEKMVTEISENSWIPEVLFLKNLVEGLCQGGYPDYAYHLVVAADKKDNSLVSNHMWDALVRLLYTSRRVRRRMSLCITEQAVDRGCDFHPLTYYVIIRGLLQAGYVSEALKQFRRLFANGKHCTKQMALVHSRLNTRLCLKCRWDEAYELHQEVVKRGLTPTRKSCNMLIKGQLVTRSLEGVKHLRRQMEQVGVFPGRKTYSLLIHGYCERDLDEACLTFDEMVVRGMKPARRSYVKLIDCLCEKGRVEEGYGVLQKIVMLESRPPLHCYNQVFQGFYESGRFHKARECFQEIVKRFRFDKRGCPISQEQLRKIFSNI